MNNDSSINAPSTGNTFDAWSAAAVKVGAGEQTVSAIFAESPNCTLILCDTDHRQRSRHWRNWRRRDCDPCCNRFGELWLQLWLQR